MTRNPAVANATGRAGPPTGHGHRRPDGSPPVGRPTSRTGATNSPRSRANLPGFLGAGHDCGPAGSANPWHVVFRFDSAEHLAAWEESRSGRAARASRSIERHRQTSIASSGLETWFSAAGRGRRRRPRKWKMFVVSLAGIYVLQLVLNPLAVTPLALPLPLRVGLVAVAVTALMTWLVMPRLAPAALRIGSNPPPRRA